MRPTNEVRRTGRALCRAAAAFLLLIGALGVSSAARAQATDRALAEELFRQGQTLMEEKRFSEACPKFAESQRLDPGTGTLLNLAVCHERQGKLASAWTGYSEVVNLARADNRPDRVAYAEERLKAIEPRLSRLTLELGPGSDVPGLVIKLDGAVVGRPALGVAVPVDPGTHNVEASAPGKHSWTATVDVGEGPSQKTVPIPALADAPADPAGQGDATPDLAAEKGAAPSDAGDGGKTQRIIAYSLGGAGIVGVGLGAVFGLSAIARNKESNSEGCNGNECSPAAAEIRKDAQAAGNVSTVAFVVGGALLAGGVVVYFTAPSASPERDQAKAVGLALGPGSVSLVGSF